ncbi:Uncharacterised protein [Klebsiella pneumoniae]|uniref:Uncharacterized protein n=2 Tax=Enterobacteriaceae TaxID=543 RepID=A0ABM8MPY5_9ENTR|nr:hypothetical protein BB744_05391 [Klebsiella pneumoniae]EKB70456.1 hypothetical protein HMPREF1306_05029 [Klebsiella pneumoniae subsp. pneumoniae WGLW2]CAB5611990.1 Uncharacterised protein [Citrobacter youngae]SAI08601.1 Uncharacterised protein [Enterobacter cloacae]SXF40363.1 Uncharacterised protein [Klebsiella variicola]VVK16651.1 Uncharacterised protein [Klebsiella quasivariicola]BBR86039.1 hypothetical protein WP4S18E06_P12000 [Klebsiella quasipneumoniae]
MENLIKQQCPSLYILSESYLQFEVLHENIAKSYAYY